MGRSDRELSRRAVLGAGAGALLASLAGCLSGDDPGTGSQSTEPRSTDEGTTAPSTTDGAMAETGTATDTATPTATAGSAAWRTVELTDVRTGETFTVDSFAGRPVLLEFFAVWCPVCTDQQERMATLLDRNDDVVAISLNVDPNEDAATVRKHVEQKGFDWRYAVLPTDATRALVDQFGTVITSPPSAPVVRVCPGGAAALVGGRGVKSADELEAALGAC